MSYRSEFVRRRREKGEMANEKDNVALAAATEQLKYETCVLRVSIHCEGCKKKVKKALQRIEGVYTTSVDAPLQKVTVTGNVAAEVLVKKLCKVGKHAEIILPPENPPPAKDGEAADGDKEKDLPSSGETPAAVSDEKAKSQEKKEEPDNGEAQNSGEKKKRKKKKKKEKKEDSVEDEGEIKEKSSLHEELFSHFPPPVHAVSYSATHSSADYGAVFYEQPTQSFLLSPLPLYPCDEQAIPSFDEENASICCVM